MSHADVFPIHANPEGGDKQFSERRLRRGKPNNKTARQREYTEENYRKQKKKEKKKERRGGAVDRYNSHLHPSKGYLLCPKHVTIIKSAKWNLVTVTHPLWLRLVKARRAKRIDALLSFADTKT